MLGEVLRIFVGTLPNIALIAGHSEVLKRVAAAAGMSDDVVDHTSEMIQ
jgi:hypothetical protein